MIGYMLLLVIVIGFRIIGENAPYGYEDEHGFHFGFPPVIEE